MQKRCASALYLATVFFVLCNPSWATDRAAAWPTTLAIRDGLVTIDTQGATIAQIIRAVGRKAQFDVRLSGNLNEPTHLSVENLPFVRFLGKLAKGHSFVVITKPTNRVTQKYPDQQIAAVYIVANFNARVGSQEIARGAAEETVQEDEAILVARKLIEESLDNKKSATPVEWKAALDSLVLFADKNSIKTLERVMVRETDSAIREDVMTALAEIDGQEATAALGRISSGHFSAQVRRLAIQILAVREGDAPRSFITMALGDHNASVRREAASVLAQ